METKEPVCDMRMFRELRNLKEGMRADIDRRELYDIKSLFVVKIQT